MPRRRALGTRDTNSGLVSPPGVILTEGTCGVASTHPNYKSHTTETDNVDKPQIYTIEKIRATSNHANHDDKTQTPSKPTKKRASSKSAASGATFSEGTRGMLTAGSSFKTTATEPKPSNTKSKGIKRKSDSADIDSANGTASRPVKKRGVSEHPKDKNNLIDVSSIHLDDEEYEEVPIYPTATDIRCELIALITSPGVSTAGLCRTLSVASGVSVSAQTLNTFRKKGKKGGNTASVDGADSPVFYATYVYLEKVRVLIGGKKSKHRLDMEEAWGEDGMCRRGLKTYVIRAGDSLEYDRLGRMVLGGRVCDHSGWRVLGDFLGW